MDTVKPYTPVAFTLIELLAVMTIMIILLSIAAAASVQWGRSARMRSARRKTIASLKMTRNWATTRNTKARFIPGDNGNHQSFCTRFSPRYGTLGTTQYLAKGIGWWTPPAFIEFNPDGTCPTNTELILYEINKGAKALATTVTVSRLTGHVKAQP